MNCRRITPSVPWKTVARVLKQVYAVHREHGCYGSAPDHADRSSDGGSDHLHRSAPPLGTGGGSSQPQRSSEPARTLPGRQARRDAGALTRSRYLSGPIETGPPGKNFAADTMRESAAAIWQVGSLNSLRGFPNSAAVGV